MYGEYMESLFLRESVRDQKPCPRTPPEEPRFLHPGQEVVCTLLRGAFQ